LQKALIFLGNRFSDRVEVVPHGLTNHVIDILQSQILSAAFPSELSDDQIQFIHLSVHPDILLVGVDLHPQSQQLFNSRSTALIRVGDSVLSSSDQLELGDDILHRLLVEELLLLDTHNEFSVSTLEVQIVLMQSPDAQCLD
jgi:hypothetical protein